MHVINWSGALFGPGSEWFWAMAQFAVVVISLIAIYRQLRAQGAANAVERMESLQGQWSSDWLRYTRLVLALDLRYGGELTNLTMVRARPLLNFFSNLDDLYSAGHIGLTEIAYSWGHALQMWYAVLTPLLERERVVHGDPNAYQMGKLLADLRRLDAKRGVHRQIGDAEMTAYLDFIIEAQTEERRLEAEWKSGAIPAAPATVAHG